MARQSVYSKILANVDWLHGLTNALLSISNILIAVGFRRVVFPNTNIQSSAAAALPPAFTQRLPIRSVVFFAAAAAAAAAMAAGGAWAAAAGVAHAEPDNAASLLTWLSHVGQQLAWMSAMGMVRPGRVHTGSRAVNVLPGRVQTAIRAVHVMVWEGLNRGMRLEECKRLHARVSFVGIRCIALSFPFSVHSTASLSSFLLPSLSSFPIAVTLSVCARRRGSRWFAETSLCVRSLPVCPVSFPIWVTHTLQVWVRVCVC